MFILPIFATKILWRHLPLLCYVNLGLLFVVKKTNYQKQTANLILSSNDGVNIKAVNPGWGKEFLCRLDGNVGFRLAFRQNMPLLYADYLEERSMFPCGNRRRISALSNIFSGTVNAIPVIAALIMGQSTIVRIEESRCKCHATF